MAARIETTFPYLELSTQDQLLRPADVRRSKISRIAQMSLTSRQSEAQLSLGERYLAQGDYGHAIKTFVKTNDVLKMEESLKGWHQELLEFIRIADQDFEEGTIDSVKSALTSYEGIYAKAMKMLESLEGKCHTQTLKAESRNLWRKIKDAELNLRQLRAPRHIFEALHNLRYLSLKKEEDLHQIVSACNTYVHYFRKLRPDEMNHREKEKITQIGNQAVDSLRRLNYLSYQLQQRPLDPILDSVLIDAIRNIEPKHYTTFCDFHFFKSEYIDLFNQHADLRQWVISLSREDFIELVAKIQIRLAPFIARKFSFYSCLCMGLPEFKLKPHPPLTHDEIKRWIEETNTRIQDIDDILRSRLDESEEKTP